MFFNILNKIEIKIIDYEYNIIYYNMANTNTSVLISQIYQSRKNVLELMDKQGFDVSGYTGDYEFIHFE